MIIGLASLSPQVGKTTVSQFLKKKHGFIHTEMSDPIIILAEKYFGFNGDKSDPAQRKILQDIGLMGKGLDPTMWLYHTIGLARRKKWGLATNDLISPSFLFYYNLKDIRKSIAEKGIEGFMEGANVVIGGIRSPGEADEISSMGGKVFLIVKNEEELNRKNDKNIHEVESHLFEYGKFEKVLINDGSFEELYNLVEKEMLGE